MALVTCNQLSQTVADMLAQLNNETMWVQGGRLYLQQGDGRTINVDMVPGLLPLLEQIDVCNTWFRGTEMETAGRKYTSTDVLATCNSLYRVWESLNDRIDNLPQDRFVSGMHSYNPATKMLTLIMSDESVVDIPLTDLIGDILDSIQLQLRDCNGDPLAQDALVPTCAQMNAADQATTNALTTLLQNGLDQIEAQLANYQLALRDANGGSLPAGTQVYSTTETNSAINAAVTAAVANLQARLRDCNNATIPIDTAIPTCAQMNVAIGNALASLPTEVHVVSGAYNATTDALVLTMNTGPAVNIPLTTLISDTINTIPHATLQDVLNGTPSTNFVDAAVAKQRMEITVMGALAGGALRFQASPSRTVAIGVEALYSQTLPTGGPRADTAVGSDALERFNSGALPPGLTAHTLTAVGHGAGTEYTGVPPANMNPRAVVPVNQAGGMTFLGNQAGSQTTAGAHSVLLGGAHFGFFTGGNSSAQSAYGSFIAGLGAGLRGGLDEVPPALRPDFVSPVVDSVIIGLRAGQAPTPIARAVILGADAARDARSQTDDAANMVAIGAGAASRADLSLGGVAIGAGAASQAQASASVVVGSTAGNNAVGHGLTTVGATSTAGNSFAAPVEINVNAPLAADARGQYIEVAGANFTVLGVYRVEFQTPSGDWMRAGLQGVADSATRLYIVKQHTFPSNTIEGTPADPTHIAVRIARCTPIDNASAIGFGAVVTGSNTVVLGNGATTDVRSTGTFYSSGVALTSDSRLKTGVATLIAVAAREFVKGLRFCDYLKHRNGIQYRQELERAASVASDEEREKAQAELDAFDAEAFKGPGRREAGLIAQEVKVLAELHGFEYVVTEDDYGVLSLDYNSIQAIINAVVIDALEL